MNIHLFVLSLICRRGADEVILALHPMLIKPTKQIVYEKILLACSILMFSLAGYSQMPGGEMSIGARLGGASGVSFKKHARSNKSAIELIGSWNFNSKNDGFLLAGTFQKLAPLSGNRLSALFGAGPAVVFGDKTSAGLAGIIGFDWRVTNPINLQLDWMPTWYFIGESDFASNNVAVTVRYVLNHRKVAGKNKWYYEPCCFFDKKV